MTKTIFSLLFSGLMIFPTAAMADGTPATIWDYFNQVTNTRAVGSTNNLTEYYTMVNSHKITRHCSTEGNQIVHGQLIGSDCKPVKKYCAWGIGAHGHCIVPCVDAAGSPRLMGKVVAVTPKICKWGPLKGQRITKVRVVDVGGAVSGNHIDIFQGLCTTVVGGICRKFHSDDTLVAQYNGQGQPALTQFASLTPGAGLDTTTDAGAGR
jgi:3D (Asp-Asp-Asp) domain-containing protein